MSAGKPPIGRGSTPREPPDRITGVLSSVVIPFKADLSPDPEPFARPEHWPVIQTGPARRSITRNDGTPLATVAGPVPQTHIRGSNQ